jgi:hypothetical protein
MRKVINLIKLSEQEQYHVEVSNRFTVLEDFYSEVDINSASGND